jgi:hypothetical protein
MMAKLTRLAHKIVIQVHLVAESYTICNSLSRCPVWELLDTPSYMADMWFHIVQIKNDICKSFIFVKDLIPVKVQET